MQPQATPPDTPDINAQLVKMLSLVTKRLHHRALSQVAPLDLTPSQGRALREITDAAEPLRIADLASRLSIAPRSATDVVDALEQAGLAVRKPNPADRRTFLLAPTPKGEELCARFLAVSAEAGRALFSCLDHAEQRQLHALLAKLNAQPWER